MATEAARLENKEPPEGRRKTDWTLTGLLMEGPRKSTWFEPTRLFLDPRFLAVLIFNSSKLQPH